MPGGTPSLTNDPLIAIAAIEGKRRRTTDSSSKPDIRGGDFSPADYYREVTDSAVFKTFSPHRSGSVFTLKCPTLFNQKHEPRL
jgi:hypothetical protein